MDLQTMFMMRRKVPVLRMRECLLFQMFQNGQGELRSKKDSGLDGQTTGECRFYKAMGMKHLGHRKLKRVNENSKCRMLSKFGAKKLRE